MLNARRSRRERADILRGVSAALLLGLLAITVLGAGPDPRAFTAADYFVLRTVTDSQISPDASQVAFVVSSVDQKRARRTSIWLARSDGAAAPIELTPGAPNAGSPRWRPDGRALAFVSARPQRDQEGAPAAQVYLLAFEGAEARPITSLADGVVAFQWSPDGTRLACVSRTRPAGRTSGSDTRRYTSIWYKFDGRGYLDVRRAHLWVVNVADGGAVQVTDGDWDDSEPEWSPDGTRLAFVSDRRSNGTDWEGRHADVWVVPAGGGDARRVSDHDEADTNPEWSPDGRSLAFLGSLSEGDHPKIYVAAAAGGPSRLVTREPLQLAARLQWPAPGDALYFEANVDGTQQLFRVEYASGRLTQTTSGPRDVRGVSFSLGDRIAYRSNDYSHPDDLFVAARDGSQERRLTTLNADALAPVQLSAPEPLTWKAADGLTIHGYVVKPFGWREGRRYPLIMQLHGGPNGMHGFSWGMDAQVFAGAGYAVFLPNPRGSSGYGEVYQRAVQNEWGGKAYTDIMVGVDAVLMKYAWIDPERMGVTGHSYGGFMTDWIVGHTDRFRAATSLAGISDFISVEGTRDAAYNHRRDFGGDLWERFQEYWDTSPLKYAPQVKTPTMILHGEADARVPLEQGEEFFRALKHFGVPAELVVFPRASHGFRAGGDPKQLVELLEWQLYWFDRWVKGNADAKPPA